MKRILILGGGFAGLKTAEELSKKIGSEHEITLVSPQRKFMFYPGLIRLALGETEVDELDFDLDDKLRKLKVRFIEGEVIHLLPEMKRVKVAGKDINGEICYDYLVIAMGRRLATEKIPGFFEHAHHFLSPKAALKFRKAVEDFQQGNIVLALAPDGRLPVPICEAAFALSRRFEDSPQSPTKITVVFPTSIEEVFGGANVAGELKEAFESHSIEVIERLKVSEVTSTDIIAFDGRSVPFDLLAMIPTFKGQARFEENGITDSGHFIEVDEFLRVKGIPDAYAAGDITSFKGPKLAHIAIGQAVVVADNLAKELAGEEPDQVYFHELSMIIDEGGNESIYLHYGVWDKTLYRLKKGKSWSYVKKIHDKFWQTWHKRTWRENSA
ncbi:MAG: FAD-dependent oxidoreductase [Pyrinomonadaceae bacterium]